MFLKIINKYSKEEKRSIAYYRLSESWRDSFGEVRQRMIISLGRLDKLPELSRKLLLCERLSKLISGEMTLFDTCEDESVEQLAQDYYAAILAKKKVDKKVSDDDLELVKLKTLQHKEVREIGCESLCHQAFKQLGIAQYLRQRSWDEESINLAATHIISRAVYPASELKTVDWIKENSAICSLTGYDSQKITKDKLYGISKKLYLEKEFLENSLSRCTNELFSLNDSIILYDLTNTYFEGRMKNSQLAKFGRSKEKRSDAKLIVLALVINTEGFLKHSDIFEGNTSDSTTLKTIIEKLNKKFYPADKKPVVVIDAGIATDANILYLREQKYDYLCVSRSNLKTYKSDVSKIPVRILDKKDQPIELMQVEVEDDTDNYLWVKSQAKALKESSMHRQFTKRFEDGLRAVKRSIETKGGIKKIEKVWERIGRLKEKYASIHSCYEIAVSDNGKGTATSLSFTQKENPSTAKQSGVYFLRTSLDVNSEQTVWTIYNAIREIEYTFRVLKTDLDLRPVYHKTDEASMAHLHLGLLAYWLVSTIRYQLKLKGIHSDWTEIRRIMMTQKIVTSTVENNRKEIIKIIQCSEPNPKVQEIYTILKYNSTPVKRRKFVWHPDEISKKITFDYQKVMSG